jgi:hypothetical protein
VKNNKFPMVENYKALSFPPADISIGGSPNWEIETLKRWLRANAS